MQADPSTGTTDPEAPPGVCPVTGRRADPVDFEFFNGPSAYREAAATHADEGAFYSASGDGFWVLTTYEGICEAFRDEEQFTVGRVSAADGAEEDRWIPLTIEGRQHTEWRRRLGAWFTPQRVRELTPSIEANARRRIEGFVDDGEVSFNEDFARPFVLENLMTAVGWEFDRFDQLLRIDRAMIDSRYAPDPREAAFEEVGIPALEKLAREQVERRRAEPADDLTTATFGWEVEGRPVTDDDRVSLLCVLFLAGVDSTVNHLANAVQHLVCHDADKRRFLASREVRPRAVEEFLRANSCMYPGRLAARDGAGGTARRGETVLLPLAVANYDPEVFHDPEQVDFDRERNPHIAFGTGAHQCLGAALARAQIRTALDVWHELIPHYGFPPQPEPSEPRFLRNAYDLRLVW